MKNKKIRNIGEDEFNALKSLKNNVICRVDKGNCIVILDKTDDIKKAEQILKLK